MMEPKPVIILVWGFVEMILFVGTIFGWPSLVYVLKFDGIYNLTCAARQQIPLHPVSNDSRTTAASSLQGRRSPSNHISSFTSPATLRRYAEIYPMSENETTWDVQDNYTRWPTLRELESETNSHHKCYAQDNYMNLAFTISISLYHIGALPAGWILDHFGLRMSRVIGSCLFVGGSLFLAFCNSNLSILIFPGSVITAIANSNFNIDNLQIGNLFGKRRATVVAICSGGVELGVLVYLVIKTVHAAGFSRMYSFLTLAGLNGVSFLFTVFVLPKDTIRHDANAHRVEHLTRRAKKLPPGADVTDGPPLPCQDELDAAENRSLLTCARSWDFLLNMFWFSCCCLILYTFLGLLNPSLMILSGGNVDTVAWYTDIQSYCMLAGILVSPIVGYMVDHKCVVTAATPRQNRYMAVPMLLPLLLTSAAAVLTTIVLAVPVLKVQYLTFVFASCFRAFLFSTHNNFIMTLFPHQHYGKLMGISYGAAGFVCLCQYPLYRWAAGPPWTPLSVYVVLITLAFTSFILPVFIWRRLQSSPEIRDEFAEL